jgi:FtsZ-interacting cell division protein ZipA
LLIVLAVVVVIALLVVVIFVVRKRKAIASWEFKLPTDEMKLVDDSESDIN